MSFLRHREIYRSEGGDSSRERRGGRPLSHRFDESPAGYSLAGCSPAEPAAASPARAIVHPAGWQDNDFSANGKSGVNCLSHPWGPR